MSSFTKPLIAVFLRNKNFKVYESFNFYLSNKKDSLVVTIDSGFITDIATTPRLVWWLVPPIGRYSKAAVVHDYFYSLALLTKKDADRAFYNGMKALGVPGWKRWIMYQSVKYFGVGNY